MTEGKPKLSWGHININVSNLEQSIEFYRKLGFEIFIPAVPYLGMTSDADPNALSEDAATALGLPKNTSARACIMQIGDGFPKLDLTEFPDLEQASPLSNGDLGIVRICLATEDLARDVEWLSGNGVMFLSDPQTGHAGLADIAICKDPDGTLIELIQVYPDRWQALLGGGD